MFTMQPKVYFLFQNNIIRIKILNGIGIDPCFILQPLQQIRKFLRRIKCLTVSLDM